MIRARPGDGARRLDLRQGVVGLRRALPAARTVIAAASKCFFMWDLLVGETMIGLWFMGCMAAQIANGAYKCNPLPNGEHRPRIVRAPASRGANSYAGISRTAPKFNQMGFCPPWACR